MRPNFFYERPGLRTSVLFVRVHDWGENESYKRKKYLPFMERQFDLNCTSAIFSVIVVTLAIV